MAGCYGNHPEDKHFERQLNAYLDEQYGDPDAFDYEAACDAADDERKRRKEESLELDK